LALDGVTTDGGVHHHAVVDAAHGDGHVDLLRQAALEGRRELAMGGVVLRDDHHTGRVLVEPMDDAGPVGVFAGVLMLLLGERHASQQGVHHRSRADRRGRMRGHAWWLVDGGEVLVFVDHRERYVLGLDHHGAVGGDEHRHDLVAAQHGGGLADGRPSSVTKPSSTRSRARVRDSARAAAMATSSRSPAGASKVRRSSSTPRRIPLERGRIRP
jgi:hypothetical protein